MRRAWLVAGLAVVGCADFDLLEREARCQAAPASCADGGHDAGADGGADAGAPPRLLELRAAWAWGNTFNSDYLIFPGAVVAAPSGRVVLLSALALATASGVTPAGYLGGEVSVLEAATGRRLQLDGGLEQAPGSSPLVSYVGGARLSVNQRGLGVYVTASERVADGGRAPPPDGGPAELPDGGYFVRGFGDATFEFDAFTLDRAYLQSLDGRAATRLLFDGRLVPAFVAASGGSSGLLISLGGAALPLPATVVGCAPEGPTDAVTTLGTFADGGPDERLVMLTTCGKGPTNRSVAAFSTTAPTAVVHLPTNTTSVRLGIAVEGTPRRAPVLAWTTPGGNALSVARLSPEGTALVAQRTGLSGLSVAQVAAVTVDDENRPTVLLSVSAGSVRFTDLPGVDVAAPSQLVAIGFDEDLRTRWIAPVSSPDPLASSGATWVGSHLIIEARCPQGPVSAPSPGGFCVRTMGSAAMKLVAVDGGSL